VAPVADVVVAPVTDVVMVRSTTRDGSSCGPVLF